MSYSDMARAATMNRPRPSSDPTHYNNYTNGDNRSDNRRRSGLEHSTAEDQPSRGRLTPRVHNNRHSDPIDRERLEAYNARRNVVPSQRKVTFAPQESIRKKELREDALARLCGFASVAEANQPSSRSSLPESARRHFMMRSGSDRYNNPQYADLYEADEAAPEKRNPKDKRVTFSTRDMYHEFIIGERPMRDPREHGASQPSHRSSAPPVLSNLRASREMDAKAKINAERTRHSAPPAPRREYRRSHSSYRIPTRKQDQTHEQDNKADKARPVNSSSRAFLETPEAKAYRKANPDAYVPVNVYDPSFVSPEKKIEQEKEQEKKLKDQGMPPFDPALMAPFMAPGMNPMMMQGFYGFPYGTKEKKSGNAFSRFRDRLIDLTCEPGYPELPSAQKLAEQTSIPRDENGDPKMPWEKSSKCRVHDPRKYVIKKNKPNQPMYVSELKALQQEEDRIKAERLAKIELEDTTSSPFHFFSSNKNKKNAAKRNSKPAQSRPRSSSAAR